jgi:hypothetical protein
MSEITSSPLCWPNGWRRTRPGDRKRAQFGKSASRSTTMASGETLKSTYKRELTINDAVTRIISELHAMGVPSWNVIISTDLQLRNDGLPISNQRTSHLDQGAAVYWKDDNSRRCMAIDRYDRIADNLGAIAATIGAMRAIERHGGAEILDRAFTGFAALPAPAAQDAPHEILGVNENATRDEINYAYRRLAQQCHPDAGGSHDQMTRINTARDSMLAAR